MTELKKFALPAALAYGGVYASTLLGSTNVLVQIAAGIAGAWVGLFVASKI